ncbi:hypothetical protein BGW36DRAFT_360255 [Talaromyces proteolyticus]|uniref:Uncharacterized protein n=1 Tax=Talaromyces proteolyticus TaxID=1131652 RepID=A0AAD4KN44_9EURO|nr:uncharacterized protein BGW36DRAFT_360255 [Talaromyces proteolyticus]KAH8696418.1 hypothetical protein BGW36DRAFT_360255 [Talaromyces proteolyticus]
MVKPTFTLAGLLTLSSEALASPDPYYFIAGVETSNPGSSINGLNFRDDPQSNGDALVTLVECGNFLYLDDKTNNLALIDYENHIVLGTGYMDDSSAHNFPAFAIDGRITVGSRRG